MENQKPAPPRLIYNDDGSNFLYSWDDLGADDLRTYLHRLQGTQVDMVAYCVAFGGYVTYYESEVAEPLGTGFVVTDRVKQRRAAHNRARLRDEVGDYISFVFSALQEMGLPAVASIRMNDAHMSSDPVGPVAGRFWMNHPQWRLGEAYGYYGSCLDYAVPAVRDYLRRLVLEVVQKFPRVAGIELDAMRSPFFFKDADGTTRAPLMTDFIAQIRDDLDQAAERNGRDHYLLRLNVPRSPELALAAGLDVATWSTEGLVDGISPGCYNTDFQLPVETWKKTVNDRVQIHPYVNCSPAAGVYLSREDYRGVAANAWAAGADGIYLFNFPCLDELAFLTPRPVAGAPFPPPAFPAQAWHADVAQTREALSEIGDQETLAPLAKRFLFYMAPRLYRHYTPEEAVIERAEAEPMELTWRCYDKLEKSDQVQIEVKLVGVTIRDQFSFKLNGEELGAQQVERLHSANGRDARVHSLKLEPYSLYHLGVTPEMLRRGENVLTVTLAEPEPDLFGAIEARELIVTVQHVPPA